MQELLQLGFIDPVTSASAGKQCVRLHHFLMSRASPPVRDYSETRLQVF